MVEGLHADFPRDGLVGQHQIKLVKAELGDQVWELAFLADHVNLLWHSQGRLQQMVSDGFCNGVGDTDPKL